jgi:hypothetical protein
LATRFTDTNSYYVSESSVYRLLKAHDLIGSPACIVIKAADEFRDKTTAPNQLWQIDFTYPNTRQETSRWLNRRPAPSMFGFVLDLTDAISNSSPVRARTRAINHTNAKSESPLSG